MSERMARLEAQEARLPGWHYSSETEPSHKCVDTVFQMITDQELSPTERERERETSRYLGYLRSASQTEHLKPSIARKICR